MKIDRNDSEYGLIKKAFEKQKEVSKAWIEFEEIYDNVLSASFVQKAKELNRSHNSSPVARDVARIIRSIFTTSFLVGDVFPITIKKLGDEDDEKARQLRVACKYYWKRANPFVEISKAFLSLLVFPVGITAQFWDDKKDKAIIKQINPTDVAFDPDAIDSDDVQYVVYRYRKSARYIRDKLELDKGVKSELKHYNKTSLKEFFEFRELNRSSWEPHKRYELEEIYIRESDGWKCKTYAVDKKILMREIKLKECPFQWGYAIEQLSSVDEKKREKQILVYGESLVGFIKEHVKAINKRRNQFDDIVEEQINPSLFVGRNAGVNPRDLKRGAGAKIPVKDIAQIMERRAPSAVGIFDDLELLKKDIENTTGVNSILKGQTGASDRRAASALAILNSQSSTRVEEMVTTANNTLFSHIAKTFVRNVYRYAKSETLKGLGISEPLFGMDVDDDEQFDFVVSVDFGSDGKREQRYRDILELMQMLGQFQNVNPLIVENLAKEAFRIKNGEDSEMFKNIFGEKERVQSDINVAGAI